jgi:dihydroorotate dehydrogenase subfamily 2
MLALTQLAYRYLFRPLLFLLSPEAAQRAAHLPLKRRALWRTVSPMLRVRDARLSVDFCGLRVQNPVGLAAGFDKDCELLPSLSALGFGFVVCGTVTESPRQGNPRPRILRYVKEESLINSLGFPGNGLESAVRRLQAVAGSMGDTPLVASVSGDSVGEIVRCHRRLEPLSDAIEVNISSPNTAGLRAFQEASALKELIGRINDGRKRPLMVKLPPYPSPGPQGTSDGEGRDRVLDLIRVCLDGGVAGLTVANSRPASEPRLYNGAGGLSGRAVFPDTLRMVADVRREVGDRAAISACGGISSGDDAWKALEAGATAVQIYTAIVYRGPGVVREINGGLVSIMRREGVDSLPSVAVAG